MWSGSTEPETQFLNKTELLKSLLQKNCFREDVPDNGQPGQNCVHGMRWFVTS